MKTQQIRTAFTMVAFCLVAMLVSLGTFHVLYVTDHIPMTSGELRSLVEGGLRFHDSADVQRGIRKGVDIVAFTGATPHTCLLCQVAIAGDVETVKLLRAHRANETFERCMQHHRDILVNCILRGETEMASALIYGGAADQSRWQGKSPLHVAIESGQLDIVRAMLKQSGGGDIIDPTWLESLNGSEQGEKMLGILHRYDVKFYRYYPYC
ncbi:MAG: ankyrin repeat domain-containing protein [Candidatus Hydrogenedentes bacterium]|nr:ankyrin repeat domain-containing protein [Candidatus Hydrogenedentota bacterium]